MKPTFFYGSEWESVTSGSEELDLSLPVNTLIKICSTTSLLSDNNTNPKVLISLEGKNKKETKKVIKILEKTTNVVIIKRSLRGIDRKLLDMCEIKRVGNHVDEKMECFNVFFNKEMSLSKKIEKLKQIPTKNIIDYLTKTNDIRVMKVLDNIDDKVLIVNPDLVKSYILLGLPKLTIIPKDVWKGKDKIKEDVIKKVGKYYKMSSREVKKILPLLKNWGEDDLSNVLNDKEKEWVGFSRLFKW